MGGLVSNIPKKLKKRLVFHRFQDLEWVRRISWLGVGRAGSEPTAAADPSWGGLAGAIYTLMSVSVFHHLTRHAYARYASD